MNVYDLDNVTLSIVPVFRPGNTGNPTPFLPTLFRAAGESEIHVRCLAFR
jgi:hypothetical protein